MPSYDNAELLVQKKADCDRELFALFYELERGHNLWSSLRQIKNFYNRAFDKATTERSALKVIDQYEQLIITISEVKLGQLTALQAHRIIDDVAENRKNEIFITNILKGCELLFWTAVAVTAFVGGLTIGIPLSFLQPILCLAVTAGAALLSTAAVNNAVDCFDDFRTYDRTNHENWRERSIFSFFDHLPLCKLDALQSSYKSTIESSSYPEYN